MQHMIIMQNRQKLPRGNKRVSYSSDSRTWNKLSTLLEAKCEAYTMLRYLFLNNYRLKSDRVLTRI